MYVQLFSWDIRSNAGLHTHRCAYFVWACSKASGKTSQFVQADLDLHYLAQVLIFHELVNEIYLKL